MYLFLVVLGHFRGRDWLYLALASLLKLNINDGSRYRFSLGRKNSMIAYGNTAKLMR